MKQGQLAMAVTVPAAARRPRIRTLPRLAPAGRLPFYALMGFTFVALVAPQGLIPALAPLRLAFVSAVLAVATHAFDRGSRAKPLTIMEPEVRLTLLLFGLAALSVPTSYWIAGSLETLLTLLAKSVVVFLLLANILVSVERLRAMLWLLTLGSAVPALFVVKDYLEGHLVRERVQGYLSALTSNPNDVALTLNIIIPLAVGLALSSARRGARLACAAAVTLGAAGVVVTFSRAGFLFLTTTLGFYFWRLKRGRIWIVLLLLLLLFLTFNVDGFVDRLSTITEVETESSARERLRTMKDALDLMIQHPLFGVGIGQSIIALNDVGSIRWRHIHNVYLEIAVDLGIPALVVYLLLLARAFRSVTEAKRAWRTAGTDRYHLAEALEISLIGFAVAAMFYPVAYHLFFYYLLGLAVAAKRLARSDVPA